MIKMEIKMSMRKGLALFASAALALTLAAPALAEEPQESLVKGDSTSETPYSFEVYDYGTDQFSKYYFATLQDAISAATVGFYVENFEEYPFNKSDPYYEQYKPYTICINSEMQNDTITIDDDITITDEVHFKIAASNHYVKPNPPTQYITFNGQITVKGGGKLIQEFGNIDSSAIVTLANTIVVESGGDLQLCRTTGAQTSPDAPETVWKTTGGEPVIEVQEGASAYLAGITVTNGGGETAGPAIKADGSVDLNGRIDSSAPEVKFASSDSRISSIEVGSSGALYVRKNKYSSGMAASVVSNGGTITVDAGGENVKMPEEPILKEVTLNGGSIEVVSTSIPGDDKTALVGSVSASQGASIILPAGSKTEASFTQNSTLKVGETTVQAPESADAQLDRFGNITLPAGSKKGDETVEQPSVLDNQNNLYSAAEGGDAPQVTEEGKIVAPVGTVITTSDGLTVKVPQGNGKVDPDNVSYVSVVYDDGVSEPVTEYILKGQKPADPADPERRKGYTFQSWETKQQDDGFAVTAIWARKPTPVILTEITEATYTIGSNGSAVLHCNGDLDEFESVSVDGTLVDAANYTLKEGSTILTFTSAYLDTLAVGQHEAVLTYAADRKVHTTLTILAAAAPAEPEKPTEPETPVVPAEPETPAEPAAPAPSAAPADEHPEIGQAIKDGTWGKDTAAAGSSAGNSGSAPAVSNVPQTGDNSNPVLWVAVMLAALAAFIGVAVIRRRNK